MIVMKFGGTSVGSAEKIKEIFDLVNKRRDLKPVVVVSAVGGVTDMLINAASKAMNKEEFPPELLSPIIEKHKKILSDLGLDVHMLDEFLWELTEIIQGIYLIREISPKTLDLISSFGEQMSSKIVAEYFTGSGLPSVAYNGWDVGIVTDNIFNSAEVLTETYANIPTIIREDLDHIPIVTGFIAKNKDGQITTLGRGGSDYTAGIVGSAIHAKEIQIWTDVNGILTTDPRLVSDARCIDKISFVEASELAYFGAKVLHPKTIHPAVKKNIPVRVLNTYNPDHPGTVILPECPSDKPFTALTFKKKVTIVRICSTRMFLAYGFMAKVFEVFKKYKLSVDMIATSEVSVSMTLNNTDNLEDALGELRDFGTVELRQGRAVICIVGPANTSKTEGFGKILKLCGENNIHVEMISLGASQVNISFIIPEESVDKCVKLLHKALFETGECNEYSGTSTTPTSCTC